MVDLAVAAPQTAESAVIFSDDFSRYSDGALSGRTPVTGGYNWVTTGAAVAGESVVSGAWSTNVAGYAYAVMQLSETPWEYGAIFESVNGTNFLPIIACIKDYTTYGITVMHHPLINTVTPSASYFSPTYFDSASRPGGSAVTAGAFVWSASSGTFALAAGVRYRYRVIINAPYVDHVVERVSDGVIMGTGRVYDPIVTSVIGPWMFLEVQNDRNFKWHSAYARAKPTSDSKTMRRVLTGLESTPIGMLKPAAANFTHVHVGSGQPKGSFSVRYDGTSSYQPGIYSSAGAAEFTIRPEATGNTGRLNVYNGAGGVAKFELDGSYNTNLYGNSGAAFLVKPVNSGTPYFAAGLKVNGSSGITQTDASAKPTTGSYTVGDFVWNKAPAIAGGKVLLGWSRLTTGSAHVLDTDWAACYSTNS